MLAQAHELIQERMEAESAATVDSRLHFFQHTVSEKRGPNDCPAACPACPPVSKEEARQPEPACLQHAPALAD